MPASADEIQEAEEEGIKIMYLVSPRQIIGNGKVEKIKMLNYVLGEKDASDRRRPEEVPGTEFFLDIDTVLSAVSQSVANTDEQDLDLTDWNTIKIDEANCATNIAGVYAGGDCARGPQNVITAIADGKRSAASIDRFLAGDNAFLTHDAEKTMVEKEKVLERDGNRPRKRRVTHNNADPNVRKRNFEEYMPLLTMKQAVEEAKRCLSCGCGAGCEICKDICKMFAWDMSPEGKVFPDKDKCVACGMCIYRCPNQNIEMIQTGTENLIT